MSVNGQWNCFPFWSANIEVSKIYSLVDGRTRFSALFGQQCGRREANWMGLRHILAAAVTACRNARGSNKGKSQHSASTVYKANSSEVHYMRVGSARTFKSTCINNTREYTMWLIKKNSLAGKSTLGWLSLKKIIDRNHKWNHNEQQMLFLTNVRETRYLQLKLQQNARDPSHDCRWRVNQIKLSWRPSGGRARARTEWNCSFNYFTIFHQHITIETPKYCQLRFIAFIRRYFGSGGDSDWCHGVDIPQSFSRTVMERVY